MMFKIYRLDLVGPPQGEVQASFVQIGSLDAPSPSAAFRRALAQTGIRRDRLAVEGGEWQKAARRAAEEWQKAH